MPTDVVEPAQLAVTAAHKQQRLANQFRREVIAGICDLTCVAYDLPCPAKDFFFFDAEDLRIGINRGGKRPGARDVGFDVKRLFRKLHEIGREV